MDNSYICALKGAKVDFLVDSHCHVDTDGLIEDERNYIIEQSIKRKIKLMTSPLTWRERQRALSLRSKFSNWIFVSIGSHPLLHEPIEPVVRFIKKHRADIVGIGEVGLDFTPPNNSEDVRKKQIDKFLIFIQLAESTKLPLIVHSRSAGKYVIDILIKNNVKKVVLHSFSGKAKYAAKGVEMVFTSVYPPP